MEEKLESSPILCRTSSAEEIDALAEELPLPLPLPFERDIENAESNHQESEGDINVSLDSSRGQEDKETPRASPTALAEVESAVAEAELEALESSSPPAGSLPRNVFLSKKERKALPFRRSTFKSQGGYFAKVQRRNRPKREDSLSQSDGSHRQRFLNEVRQQSGLSLEDESSADDIMNNQIIYDDDLTLEDENTSDGKPHATATTPLHRQQRHKKSSSTSTLDHKNQMSMDDIEICQRLDEEYERALEEREIGYNARYGSVRQSAFLSVFFMFTFLCLGTLFFMRQTAWTVPDALLFSIYTITTVGYGNVSGAPTTPGFQAYTIFYILVGVAALTIMVSNRNHQE